MHGLSEGLFRGKNMFRYFFVLGAVASSLFLSADNQTATVSPVLPSEDLPFTIEVTQADFMLPSGLHSFASGVYDDKWLLIAGRMNGLHGFGSGNNNFAPDQQNTQVYVVDHHKKKVWTRDLHDTQSGFTQDIIDTLTVTSPQYYQSGNTLYMSGGYGVDTATGEFSTKNTLSAIDIPGLINWAMNKTDQLASKYIRQTSHESLRVTGGAMAKIGNNSTLLVFGQNFKGYYLPNTNGAYTQQVRRFCIEDDGKTLRVRMKEPIPATAYPSFRRRDLNVVPIMECREGKSKPALMAYSGVFTLSGGTWTLPVVIRPDGFSSMDDPSDPATFKQAMNNYVSATLGLYSEKQKDMYTLFFGGISFGYFNEGQLQTDPGFPFINQITTIKRSKDKKQAQYLMDATYPTILSQQSNPGNPLLFGAGATFFPKTNVHYYSNGVVKFDRLKKKKIHIGHIVGGIQSTLPNTSSESDSAGSPYVFKVYIKRK